jgi:hypothetical protein
MIGLRVSPRASSLDAAWSRVNFEKLDDPIWLKNAACMSVVD